MDKREQAIARQTTWIMLGMMALAALLVLDLINRGLVWRALQSLRSQNNSTLPNERRTIGDDSYQTDVNFLS